MAAMDIESIVIPAALSLPEAAPVEAAAPIPLSFPAILRNPGLNDRFAHLSGARPSQASGTSKKLRRRTENDGKRWARRKDNDRFIGNVHIVVPSRKDYNVEPTRVRPTFPEPLPAYLPRTAKLPATEPPAFDPSSANSGRFSLSLKGMRRDLRRSGRRAQFLVRDVELVMSDWLTTAGAVLDPDAPRDSTAPDRKMVGESESIFEVSRTPFQLVWCVNDDAFARYVVHCCARYHEVVSYSKEVAGERLTYLLRPNVTRPDFFAPTTIASPPVTDIDSSSQFDTESDFTDIEALSEFDSDVASLAASSRESLVHVRHPNAQPMPADELESWSVHGDSASESGLPAIENLTITDDATPRRQLPLRARQLQHRSMIRSSSSPSRSPVRLSFTPRRQPPASVNLKPSFYTYLFS